METKFEWAEATKNEVNFGNQIFTIAEAKEYHYCITGHPCPRLFSLENLKADFPRARRKVRTAGISEVLDTITGISKSMFGCAETTENVNDGILNVIATGRIWGKHLRQINDMSINKFLTLWFSLYEMADCQNDVWNFFLEIPMNSDL